MNACASAYNYSDVDRDGSCCRAESSIGIAPQHDGPCCSNRECDDCPAFLVEFRQ